MSGSLSVLEEGAPPSDVLSAAGDDWDLLFSFRDRGDLSSWERLYLRHRDPLFSFAVRMLRQRQDAEEVTTEAFCRMVRGPGVRRVGTFKAFAFTVVRRLCLDKMRRQAVSYRLRGIFSHSAQPSAPTPEEVISQSQRLAALERALGTIPPGHREVLLLYYTHDLSTAEVGDVLGTTDQQVRSKLAYARRLLRDALEVHDGPK